ncbi:hypothetical protein V1264_013256 [Littorina saxatilis]|uniref:Serpin domain-containing protein n=1 Tax=Littorina saxatilis TaxID=31220 RepID=A0AAN9BP76_9CAEN
MARKSATFVCVLLLVVNSCVWATDKIQDPAAVPTERVPLYIRKARLYAQRREAYEQIMQTRMAALAHTTNTFATQLYSHHVTKGNNSTSSHHGNSGVAHLGNVLLSPLSAYASLAMTMTASRGVTKREVIAVLNMEGEGRGVHAALERALTSLRNDDNDDVNSNLDDRGLSLGAGEGEGGEMEEDAGLDMMNDQDLENIIRNDYALDSTISYNTGHEQIRYRSRVKTSSRQHTPPPQPDMHIRLANGMFHSEELGLSQQFSNRLASLYGAPPMAMPGQEPQLSVNLWVDAVTRGAVPGMLNDGDVTANTSLALISAFSFRGAWETNFDEAETIPLEFQTAQGESVMAACMYRTGNYSLKVLDQMGGAKVLEVPYANQRYSLFVVLPKSASRLHEVEQGFQTLNLLDALSDMPQPAMTIVILPKFRLQVTTSLGEELEAMGLKKLFTQGQADFRRMTDEAEGVLFVNRFFQHAAFQVDEGTRRERDVQIGSDLQRNLDLGVISGGVKANSSGDRGDVAGDGGTAKDDVALDDHHGVLADEANGGDSKDGDYYDADDDELYDDDDDYDVDDEEDYDWGESHSDGSSNYFIATRPFHFVVMDKKYDLILLLGRVTNPLP